MKGAPRVGVLVPARDEERVIGACLWSLLTQVHAPPMMVVVVANGCQDRTAEVARQHSRLAALFRHQLLVLEEPAASKARALNQGERHLGPGIRVVIDADVVLGAGALVSLIAALDCVPAKFATLRASVYEPRSRQVRDFFRVWDELPSVRGKAIGAGVYGVNVAGRGRWQEFPELAADDAFVRTRFAVDETVLIEAQRFLVVPPATPRELRRTIRRWREADRQLPPPVPGASLRAGTLEHARALLRRPSIWHHLPGFVRQQALGRLRHGPPASASWTHAGRGARTALKVASLPRVHVVIVTHNSASAIDRCLDALIGELPRSSLTLTVVDNNSTDGTVSALGSRPDAPLVVTQNENLGFGRAANLGASLRPSDSDYLLFLNPDAWLAPGALRCLLAIARRFPQFRMYGGQPRDESGEIDPSACLSTPSLKQALTYAACVHRFVALRKIDPDALGGWKRDSVREVPVITGSLLLIETALWIDLGGFDERYVLYGEDVDLCLRARRLGARPLFSHLSSYLHLGGASASSATEREIMILRGKSELYRQHLRVTSRLAIASLQAGVAIRALLSSPGSSPDWRVVLRARRSWRAGFETAHPSIRMPPAPASR